MVKVASARYLHCKVTFFPFIISSHLVGRRYFEILSTVFVITLSLDWHFFIFCSFLGMNENIDFIYNKHTFINFGV